jgi:hypothetical protein
MPRSPAAGREEDAQMGLFKDAKNKMQDAMGAAGAAGQMPEGMQMPDMASMQAPDPAYVAMVNKIGKSGVEAPAQLKSIRAVGSPDMSGATLHEFDVSITPSGASAYDTTIKQSMLAAQMQGLSEGKAVTVKYDPDNPKDALLSKW